MEKVIEKFDDMINLLECINTKLKVLVDDCESCKQTETIKSEDEQVLDFVKELTDALGIKDKVTITKITGIK